MSVPSTAAGVIRPLDRDALRAAYRSAEPVPFFKVDGFLDDAFAREVAASMPGFEEAQRLGYTFRSVNERLKLQVSDRSAFPAPVLALHRALAAPEFLSDLGYVTGIEDLLADEELEGGGMHETGPGGRLDVHVDFNILESRGWHRRLNILVYLNPDWRDDWGGRFELWDAGVKSCRHSFAPILNRCVVFETGAASYHGVTPLTAPAGVVRKSFAAYYYTVAPPPAWDGRFHQTVFRARPSERFKAWVAMPFERVSRGARARVQGLKRTVKRAIGR